MPAVDALTVRTLVQEQLQGVTFRAIIDAFMADVQKNGFENNRSYREPRLSRVMGSEQFANALSVAETYYLSPEMHDICLQASQAVDFPDDETILREDPPSDAGFMYLPARFRIIEMRGRLMVAHALLWFNNRIWWLCDRRDPEDEMNQYLNEVVPGGQSGLPRYDLMFISGFHWGEPMPKSVQFEKGVLPSDAKVTFMREGNKMLLYTDAVINPEQAAPYSQVSPDLKFLLTVWRIMQQTLAEVVREEPAGKPARRYAERAGIKDFGVHVIQLRRREGHATGTGAPLTVRFPVRGHWRRIWCGPAENRYQRAVYIHPYIKGPEGAPLIHRERINALMR